MSLLAKQLDAFRLDKALPESQAKRRALAPSILFTPQEAKQQGGEAFAALALRGIAGVAALDPDLAVYAQLFEGRAPDREFLTPDEGKRLDGEIRRLLLLLSPHLPLRVAQEVLEGLLYRFHVHKWNVDEVLACALPYHDSPLFTRLVQGLQFEAKPKWSWLAKFKAGPTTLVRAALAKYCAKDLSVLTFIGCVLRDTAELQKSNRALSSFFTALWLDTLAAVATVSSGLVEAAMPPLLHLLRTPHLRESFHAALTVASALCVKVNLSIAPRAQLVERAVRHIGAPGAEGRACVAFLALHSQQQDVEDVLSAKLLRKVAGIGAETLAGALPPNVDCSNLIGALVRCSLRVASAAAEKAEQPEDGEEGVVPELCAFAASLLAEEILAERYAEPMVEGALQAFCEASGSKGRVRMASVLAAPLRALGDRWPTQVGGVFKRVVDAALAAGLDAEAVAELMAPACSSVADGAAKGGALVPVVQAFSHKSVAVRQEALTKACEDLEAGKGDADLQRQRLLASMALQLVQDSSVEVALCALQCKPLWASLPQASPAMGAAALQTLLNKLLGDTLARGVDLQAMFGALFVAGGAASQLVPPALRCCAWVVARKNCPAEVRDDVDSLILPFVVLAASALDGGSASTPSDLRAALLEFCGASKHEFLANFKGGESAKATSSLCSGLLLAATCDSLQGLCNVVEGRPWARPRRAARAAAAPSLLVLGGEASQAAATTLLSAALPRALALPEVTPERAGALLARCAEACHRVALHRLMLGGGSQPVCALVRALFSCGAGLRGKEASTPTKRRKSKGSASTLGAPVSIQGTLGEVFRLVLERPKEMAGELRTAVGSHGVLILPALLRQALLASSPRASGAATANSLLLLRSLLTSTPGSGGVRVVPDQSLLAPVVAQLARAASPEVRSGALAVLDALRGVKWAVSPTDGSTELRKSLQDAGVLRPNEEVLPQAGWSAAAEKKLEVFGMTPDTVDAFLEHVLALRADIARDREASVAAVSKFMVGKGGVMKASRLGACAFWGVGLATLTGSEGEYRTELLSALPAAGFLGGLDVPLATCADDVISKLGKDDVSVACVPALLHLAAVKVLDVLGAAAAPKATDSKEMHPAKAAAENSSAFVRQISLPIIAAVAKRYRAGGAVTSQSMVDLIDTLCRTASLEAGVDGSLSDEAACALLDLCVASFSQTTSSAAGNVEADAEAVVLPALPASQRAPAAARAAFAGASLSAQRLDRLLGSPAFEGKALAVHGHIALALLQPHVVALGGKAMQGAQAVLVRLAALAKASAAKPGDAAAKELLAISMGAIAALSERLGATSAQHVCAKFDAGATCDAIAEVCKQLGDAGSSGTLAAAIRTCSALAPLMKAILPPKKSGLALETPRLPAPLQACIVALESFAGPMDLTVLGLLKANLPRLRRFPEALQGAAESAADASMRRDVIMQSRLRSLLQTVFVGRPTLLQEPSSEAFFSLAESVGLQSSLDFAILLLLARRSLDSVDGGKKKKKIKPKKRRAGGEVNIEAVLEDAGLTLDIGDDAAADEALRMLTAAPMDCRYQALGTLVQTLCNLACRLHRESEASQTEGALGPLWGPALLPEQFTTTLGRERLFDLLEAGLAVVSRFITEHGIPGDLDEESGANTSAYRTTAPQGDGDDTFEGSSPRLVAALSLCYALRGASMLEVVLIEAGAGAEKAAGRAKHLRGLLMRSLAVNHPVTFFRSVCFALNLPAFSPSAALVGALKGDGDFQLAQASCVLRGVCEAMSERQELAAEAGADADEDADDEEEQALCAPFCAAAMRHVCQQLLGKAAAGPKHESLRVAAWQFLGSLCRFSASAAPEPVLDVCVPAATACLFEKGPSSSQAAIASCACLQTVVEQLGRNMLPKLNVILSALLDLVTSAGDDTTELDPLQASALRTLDVVVRSVGAYTSPFLERLLAVCSAASPPWRTALLEKLGEGLVAGVPHRLLLPAVQAATAVAVARIKEDGGVATGLVTLQRLAVFQVWLFSASTPEAVAASANASAASLMQLFVGGAGAAAAILRSGGKPTDISIKLFDGVRSRDAVSTELAWAEQASRGHLGRLNALGAAAFAQFALRLTEGELRPCFGKVLAWARNTQPQVLAVQGSKKWSGGVEPADIARDTEDACRALALVATMKGLVEEAPDIAEVILLPSATKDVAACLVAARKQALHVAQARGAAGKKRRRAGLGVPKGRNAEALVDNTWWWLEVLTEVLGFIAIAMRQAGAGTGQTKEVEDALEALVEPCTNVLDVFEYIPAVEEGASLTVPLLDLAGRALVALIRACDAAGVKRLLTGILGKTRSEDAEVRLSSVKICHRIWQDVGVQAVSGLSEVVMYAAELLEDEDPRIETAVRAMIKTMEDCTGESLQDSLKH